MKISLDRFGRLVVPKEIRDKFGLRAGDEIEIEEGDNEVVLKPAQHESPLQIEDGVLVFTGASVGDLTEAVHTHRAERISRVAKGRKA